MKPNKEDFMYKITSSLDKRMRIQDRQVICEQIYNVLFDLSLSDLTSVQIGLLAILLHSKKSGESTDILDEIKDAFPSTTTYITNLHKHKNLLPKGGDNVAHQIELFASTKKLEDVYGNRVNFIKGIHKSLIDIFSIPNDFTVLNKEIWQGFVKEINLISKENALYISKSFDIHTYDPSIGYLKIHIDNEEDANKFESSYLSLLKDYFKKIEYKLRKLEYDVTFQTKNNLQSNLTTSKKTINPQNIANLSSVISTIGVKYDPAYTRDSFQGKQKEHLKEMLIAGKNIFIGGNENLGKSHLIQAVIKKCEEEKYAKKIVYTNGNKIYDEIQKLAAEDRKNKKNNIKTDKIKLFLQAFDDIDILVIDDFAILGGAKTYTQNIINAIHKIKSSQIVMLSSFPPVQIQWHERIPGCEGSSDYRPVSLTEKFSMVFVEMQPVDLLTKKKIAKDMRGKKSEPNLFMTEELKSGVIDFMTEHISPKIYPQLIESIMRNIQGNETTVSQKIYDVIENITGKTLVPEQDTIVDVIVEEFNLDDIKHYLDKEKGGLMGNIDKDKIYNDKWVRSDSIEGVVLRACIYFIKKYYPPESFETIGAKFNRTNAASLYSEGKEWLTSKKQLETFLDKQIKLSVQKKYGLQHNI